MRNKKITEADLKEQLKIAIQEFNIDDNDLIQKIIDSIKPLRIKKGEFFCKAGQHCNKLGIIVDGLLRAHYEVQKKDATEEVTSRFFYKEKNIIVTSFESFKNSTITYETIEAVEDSLLFTIGRDNLYNLFDNVPQVNKLGRELAENSYILALKRIHDLQTLSVSERIKKFYAENKYLIKRLPINYITSYLGVSRNQIANYLKDK